MKGLRSYDATSAQSHASALNGMPAAFDSLSRQRRVALLNGVRPKLNTTQQAVSWAFKVLESIAVPGVPAIPASVDGVPVPADGTGDFTQWQLVRDHTAKTLYSRTWDNPMPKRLALADVDLRTGARPRTFTMGAGTFADEISPEIDEL